jgi:hypothetical protein
MPGGGCARVPEPPYTLPALSLFADSSTIRRCCYVAPRSDAEAPFAHEARQEDRRRLVEDARVPFRPCCFKESLEGQVQLNVSPRLSPTGRSPGLFDGCSCGAFRKPGHIEHASGPVLTAQPEEVGSSWSGAGRGLCDNRGQESRCNQQDGDEALRVSFGHTCNLRSRKRPRTSPAALISSAAPSSRPSWQGTASRHAT